MQRFTISLDDTLAEQFDSLIADKGYGNRSEAVRDLIRLRLGQDTLGGDGHGTQPADAWCVANVSYVYDHHEQPVISRILDLLHGHHDLVITSVHTHLDHDNCMETAVLRGPLNAVKACAEQLVAIRGVRHGHMNFVPLAPSGRAHTHPHAHPHVHSHGEDHRHDHGNVGAHVHLKPIN